MLRARGCRSLAALPDSLARCELLRVLSVASCTTLVSLPRELADCRRLRVLNVFECVALTGLPRGLHRLDELEVCAHALVARQLRAVGKTRRPRTRSPSIARYARAQTLRVAVILAVA